MNDGQFENTLPPHLHPFHPTSVCFFPSPIKRGRKNRIKKKERFNLKTKLLVNEQNNGEQNNGEGADEQDSQVGVLVQEALVT